MAENLKTAQKTLTTSYITEANATADAYLTPVGTKTTLIGARIYNTSATPIVAYFHKVKAGETPTVENTIAGPMEVPAEDGTDIPLRDTLLAGEYLTFKADTGAVANITINMVEFT
jgi:hypothetical protein